MLNEQMEQEKRFNFDLQFFAEPGEGSEIPPSNEGNQNVGEGLTSQAEAPLGTTEQPASQTKMVDWNTHQAAIKGMNEAQRKAAELEKRAAYADQIDADPMGAVKQYLSQNPDALTALLRENPIQAAQIMGQVFNNQQPQVSPYENVQTYDEFGNIVEKRTAENTLKQVQQQYDPRLTAVENFIKQQHENGVKAQLNPKIPETLRDKVWSEVGRIGIPIATIEAQPWLIDGLIIQASGGREEYDKLISTQKQTKKVEQVLNNYNNTASLVPNGGVAATQSNESMTWNERKKLAARQVASINST